MAGENYYKWTPPQCDSGDVYASPDYTGKHATGRALKIDFGIVKFGTRDAVQGAALFIFLMLVLLLIVLGTIPTSHTVLEKWAPWLSNIFSLVIGAAVARASKPPKKRGKDL